MHDPARLFVSFHDLPALGWPLSKRQTLRLEAEGRFPKRVTLGAKSKFYLREEVEEHIRRAAAAREPATAPPEAA